MLPTSGKRAGHAVIIGTRSMAVELHIRDEDLARIRRSVERKIAHRMEKLAVTIYNAIVLGPEPIWSGAYASSWSIGVGSPDVIDNASPHGIRAGGRYIPTETFTPASPVEGSIGMSSPYEPIFISNYSMRSSSYGNTPGHAGIVEYQGTPKHPAAWNIATHAKSEALTAARFF